MVSGTGCKRVRWGWVLRDRAPLRTGAAFALFLAFIGVVAVSPARADPPLRVLLNWCPNSAFSAFYMAEDAGGYAGLNISLQHLGQNVVTTSRIAQGLGDVGVASPGELIAARAAGMKLRAVAALFQRSPIVFISKAEYGITRPSQIAGQTVRITSEMAPILDALLAAAGADNRQWTPATYPSDPALFMTSPAKVWGVYDGGMAQTLAARGEKINVIYPEDYGLGLYGSVLFVRDDLLVRDLPRLRSFVAATLAGLNRAIEQPDEATAATLRRESQLQFKVERDRLIASIPLFRSGSQPLGTMNEATWRNAMAVAGQAGVEIGGIQVSDLFTLQALPQ